MSIVRETFSDWMRLVLFFSKYLVEGGDHATEKTTFFKAIEMNDPGYGFTAYADVEKTHPVLTIGNYGTDQRPVIFGYKSDTVNTLVSNGTNNVFSSFDIAELWMTDGGVYLEIRKDSETVSDSYPRLFLIITKNNHGVTTLIFSGQGCYNDYGSTHAATFEEAMSTAVSSVARGDDTSARKIVRYTPSARNQTKLVPFTTFSAFGTTSYTPCAFYCEESQSYTIGNNIITYNGINYFTNGYWVIKDAEVSV